MLHDLNRKDWTEICFPGSQNWLSVAVNYMNVLKNELKKLLLKILKRS